MKLLQNVWRSLLALSLLSGISIMANAESVEIDGLIYELNAAERSAAVTSYNAESLSANVVIPSTVQYSGNSYDVTTINNGAFKNFATMESISIPGSVVSIGTYYNESNAGSNIPPYNLPFIGCSRLRSVRLEDGSGNIDFGYYFYTRLVNSRWQTVSHDLFEDCPLEELYIGRNITRDGNSICSAFQGKTITKVVFGEYCTVLPDQIFSSNNSLAVIDIPHVETIGMSAFSTCQKLTTVNFGNSLKTVGNYAFANCSSLTKLTFPNSLTEIGNSAFYDCNSVTEVTVGSGLKSIGSNAFARCRSFTAIILPDGFTTMGESAFAECGKLTIAKLGSSLTSVPSGAFYNCYALSEMFIPASVTSIGDSAFYNDSGIANLTMEEGVETIGSEVFYNNSGLVRMEIPGTVKSIGKNSFYGCTRIAYLTLRQGEEELVINNEDTKSALKSGADVGNKYFYDCPLRFLTIGRNLTYSYSSGSPFYDKESLVSVTITPNVTFLYHKLLYGCSGLKKLTLPDGLTHVYSYALAWCSQVTELEFPEPLVLLDDGACSGNSALTSVLLKETPGNDLSLTIGASVFQQCEKLSQMVFPSKTVSVGNNCFRACNELVSVILTDSHKEISLGVDDRYNQDIPLFYDSKLKSLYVGRNIAYSEKYSFNPDLEKASCSAPFSSQHFLSDVVFSQAGTVTYVKKFFLYEDDACNRIVLPESLRAIGDYAFAEMSELTGIIIPNNVTVIGKYAFFRDRKVGYAKLSTSCAWLREGVFSDCNELVSITIPPIVTKMDTKLFRACESLATVTFESGSELINMAYGASNLDYGLFRDCPLVTLNLDRWLQYDTSKPSHSPFYSIAELKNLNIGENVKVIDKYMFSYCTGLEEVNLPDHIESVGLWGFRGCTALKNVHLSASLSQISDYGFAECTVLDNVVFPDKMTSVSDHGFADCVSLTNLDLGNSLNIIGPAAFKNCVKLNGITIPETLYGLGVESFANCTSLPNVTIRSITSVGKQAFEGCTGLRWVSLSDKTTSVGENSFAGCTGIGYVKSYAEFPPEGLVNFVESVPENGTLFVPENSIDYYAYSPTWENWKDIRPLNDNVMVSSVTLDKTEYSFKAAETVRLTATVGAENATDKAVVWRSADETVATVDETGTVTAAGVGETIVSAVAADGSGEKGECRITVVPTPVASIVIASDVTAMKKGRTMSLAATVSPATATEKGLRWSSSDISVAVVNSEGVVTTKLPGAVTITAAATDGSEVTSTFELTVLPLTKGDSNDNDELTITDAVNTANYAVGNEVANFCVEAADVNGDNRITLADASGTVTLVLEQPMVTAARKLRDALSGAGNAADCLVADDYDATPGLTSVIGVRLDNSIDYVALQGDIILPEGMVMEDIAAGARVAGTHALAVRRVDDRRARVALFALDNAAFADTDGSLFDMTVRVGDNVSGNIGISNIVAADAGACEYILTSAGGYRAGTSGVDSISYTDLRIEAGEGVIRISNAAGKEISVFAADGTLLSRFTAREELETRRLTPGVYVVTAAEKSFKVMVK